MNQSFGTTKKQSEKKKYKFLKFKKMAIVNVPIFKKDRVKLTKEDKIKTESKSWYGYKFETTDELVINSTSIVKGVILYDVGGLDYYELLLTDNSSVIVNGEGLKLLSI